MKVKLTIICVMSAICAVSAAQKPSAKKTSFSESELRALAKAVPDVKNAGQLYSVAMVTSNDVDRQQAYLRASAAGLIACGKTDIYKKHIKGKLQNVTEFEDGLKDDCKQCSGNGTKDQRCLTCRGNGKCPSCKGTGQIMTTVSLSFDKQSKPCGKCNESGRCPKCDGEGSTMEKCFACAGTGKVFSKSVAERVFRNSCNAIADGVDVVPMPKNADVNHRVNVNLEQQRTKQQNVVGEQLQRRSRRGRAEGGPARTMASSDHQIDNKLLEKLKDFKRQNRYRLEDVVSAGNAILSTSKVPSEVISGTPFGYYGPDNDLKFKMEVRAIVKSAQTLLSDIEANQTEISAGEFKPDYYIEYWHKDTTDLRKRRLFDEVWEKALYSPHLQRDANNNPLGKVLHSKVPDNMVFVVSDVSLVELRGGVNVYCVKLTALAFGKENYTLGRVWNGRKDQTERYVELAKKAGALESSTVRLLVPTSHGDVEKWKKGDTVISKGWLNEWNIINAVRTYGNGEKGEYRKIEMSGEMFRSLRDWEEINTHVSQ